MCIVLAYHFFKIYYPCTSPWLWSVKKNTMNLKWQTGLLILHMCANQEMDTQTLRHYNIICQSLLSFTLMELRFPILFLQVHIDGFRLMNYYWSYFCFEYLSSLTLFSHVSFRNVPLRVQLAHYNFEIFISAFALAYCSFRCAFSDSTGSTYSFTAI